MRNTCVEIIDKHMRVRSCDESCAISCDEAHDKSHDKSHDWITSHSTLSLAKYILLQDLLSPMMLKDDGS